MWESPEKKTVCFRWVDTIYRIGLSLAMVRIGTRYQTRYRWSVTNRNSGVMQPVAVKAINAKSLSPDSVTWRSPVQHSRGEYPRWPNSRKHPQTVLRSMESQAYRLQSRWKWLCGRLNLSIDICRSRRSLLPQNAIRKSKARGVAKTGIRRQLSHG